MLLKVFFFFLNPTICKRQIEDSSEVESCGHISKKKMSFSRPKNTWPLFHHLAFLSREDIDKKVSFRILWWQKWKRKLNSMSSPLVGDFWDLRKFLSLPILTFSIWQPWFLLFLPVFLMELEINMAFCLPPNLCAAIIDVSIVLGIGFVYCFCWASKWRNAERSSAHPILV